MNLEPLHRFRKMECDFKLTKLNAKSKDAMVRTGHVETGVYTLIELPTKGNPDAAAVQIVGNGYSYLRTSAILKILDFDENSTTFETIGGVYKLEKI